MVEKCSETIIVDEKCTLTITTPKAHSIFQEINQTGKFLTFTLFEGLPYEYEFSNKDYSFSEKSGNQIIKPSLLSRNHGVIEPNTFIGSVPADIINNGSIKCTIQLNIQTIKADFANNYRYMLEDISTYSTTLLLYAYSPAMLSFSAEFNLDFNSLYQKFQLIKQIVLSENFDEAVRKILSNPVSRQKSSYQKDNSVKIKKLDRRNLKELTIGTDRFPLNDDLGGLKSIPRELSVSINEDTYDVPENQFIKSVLDNFSSFFEYIERFETNLIIKDEARSAYECIQNYLSDNFFLNISALRHIIGNNTILQKKDGYHEVFQAWLLSDSLFSLTWSEGEDIFLGGMKNVSLLYEYWCYFSLLEIFKEMTTLTQIELSKILVTSNSGVNLNLGKNSKSVMHSFLKSNNNVQLSFYFNRSYTSGRDSWSVLLKPDFTFEIKVPSEDEFKIYRIHFDAKYKVKDFHELFQARLDQSDELLDIDSKNEDLVKMHAYKDGIIDSVASFILYPGSVKKLYYDSPEKTHGIGAIPLNPGENTRLERQELQKILEYLVEKIISSTLAF